MNKYQEALDDVFSEHPMSKERNLECKKLLQELVLKETPKEPIIDSGVTYCPICHWVVELTFVHNNHNCGLVVRPDKYCHNCGQRLREK